MNSIDSEKLPFSMFLLFPVTFSLTIHFFFLPSMIKSPHDLSNVPDYKRNLIIRGVDQVKVASSKPEHVLLTSLFINVLQLNTFVFLFQQTLCYYVSLSLALPPLVCNMFWGKEITHFFLSKIKKANILITFVLHRFLPYVGWVTIIMTEKPIIKVCCGRDAFYYHICS